MLPIRVFTDAIIVRTKESEGLKAPGYLTSRLSDDFSFIDCHSTTYLMIKRYFSKSIPILGERYSLMPLRYRLP
jgi:hypothetical protein